MRLFFALLLLLCLAGCVQSSAGRSAAQGQVATAAIKSEAEAAKTEAPVVAGRMDRIIANADVAERSIEYLGEDNESLRKDNERLRSADRNKLMQRNASLFAIGVLGLVGSIIVALWFKTPRALSAAVGFAVLVAVTLAVSVFAQALAWIGLIVVAVAGLALGGWVWYDNWLDQLQPRRPPSGPADRVTIRPS